jgi:hypothetical protein
MKRDKRQKRSTESLKKIDVSKLVEKIFEDKKEVLKVLSSK